MAEISLPVCHARGDNEEPHCWHDAYTLTMNPGIPVERCCWCGETRHRPPLFTVGVQQHGPHFT